MFFSAMSVGSMPSFSATTCSAIGKTSQLNGAVAPLVYYPARISEHRLDVSLEIEHFVVLKGFMLKIIGNEWSSAPHSNIGDGCILNSSNRAVSFKSYFHMHETLRGLWIVIVVACIHAPYRFACASGQQRSNQSRSPDTPIAVFGTLEHRIAIDLIQREPVTFLSGGAHPT